ncbi:MAG: Flp pilus assembly protein CpaB [Deferrisomatales bacterium]|nr:Flp pilus assembly protein CpaB [Deferrisomatales bacterium]
MKYGAFLALVLAVLSGVAAVFLANRFLASRTEVPAVVVRGGDSVPSAKVVIAARELEVGSRLTAGSLAVAEWPAAAVPRGAFHQVEPLEGRVVVNRLRAGHPVLSSELAAPGSGAGLVATLQPGQRAMSIRVDDVVGVSGFVLPNTFVDVIAVTEDQARNRKVQTILERIEVLAIAQETFTEEGKPKVVKTVTLAVAPDQAEKLALQTHEGPIHLVLRNPAEDVKPEPAAVAEAPKPAPAPAPVRRAAVPTLQARVRAPAPSPHTVEVIRGAQAESVRFKSADSEERMAQ